MRNQWKQRGLVLNAMKTPTVLMILIAICGLTASAQAQLPNNEQVADVMAYDEEGKPFHFREKMKGKYSVVVFGCLT